jgi:hypothetical protein
MLTREPEESADAEAGQLCGGRLSISSCYFLQEQRKLSAERAREEVWD